jgi:hypothetical protein
LFLKLKNHPGVSVLAAGIVNVPVPPVQTIVWALVASLIVGVVDTTTGAWVVANLPTRVVRPAPWREAASAADVPVPNVRFSHTPVAVELSDR